MIRQVVILAGGKGTRMSSYSTLAKSLQLIQCKSILERQIEFFFERGFRDFLLLLGEKSPEIIKELKKINLEFGIHIKYLTESSPLGTGGALLNAFDFLDEQFILILGDLVIETDLAQLIRSIELDDVDFGLFYHPSSHPQDSDLLKLNSNQIIEEVLTKPRESEIARNHGNAGCYVFKKGTLGDLVKHFKGNLQMDLDRQLIPSLVKDGFKGKGVRNTGFIQDCGTPMRLQHVNQKWNAIKNRRMARSAIFLDRDGTLIKQNGFITKPEQIEVFEDAPSFISLMNQLNFWVIIVTNQPVIARGEISCETLDEFHARIENIVLNGGGIIDDFFFCPHHPDAGFVGEVVHLKIPCKCRKPETGLIEQACERYPIDLRDSWMVGDTWRDSELAKNVGINFIEIVTNGSYGIDSNQVGSLTEAASIILESTKML